MVKVPLAFTLALGAIARAQVSAPTDISTIPASTLTQITDFGTNPSNVGMYVYRPATVASNPSLITAIHYCGGTAQAYFEGTRLAQLAETYGYIPNSGTCWDVSSNATLTHDGGSDSLGIVSGARFAVANWDVPSRQVFAVGTSSGAMMANALAGAYPDVFSAVVVDSGVPYGCFKIPGQPDTVNGWNSQCSQGQLIQTGDQWAALVHDGFPGFTGTYPKVQTWHGTADEVLLPQNFFEQIKQWTTIFGYSSTPSSNVSESYLPAGYSNATYGPRFQAILAQGVGHTVPTFEQQYLEFFGIA